MSHGLLLRRCAPSFMMMPLGTVCTVAETAKTFRTGNRKANLYDERDHRPARATA